MMNTYCLKCKKSTKDLNSKGFVTKNKKFSKINMYYLQI